MTDYVSIKDNKMHYPYSHEDVFNGIGYRGCSSCLSLYHEDISIPGMLFSEALFQGVVGYMTLGIYTIYSMFNISDIPEKHRTLRDFDNDKFNRINDHVLSKLSPAFISKFYELEIKNKERIAQNKKKNTPKKLSLGDVLTGGAKLMTYGANAFYGAYHDGFKGARESVAEVHKRKIAPIDNLRSAYSELKNGNKKDDKIREQCTYIEDTCSEYAETECIKIKCSNGNDLLMHHLKSGIWSDENMEIPIHWKTIEKAIQYTCAC